MSIKFDPADDIFEQLIQKTSTEIILPHLEKLSKEQFQRLLDLLSDAYHNEEPIISDDQYDRIERKFEDKFGPNKKVGAPPKKTQTNKKIKSAKPKSKSVKMIDRPSGSRVQSAILPIPLFGLGTRKDFSAVESYRKRYPKAFSVRTDKLDGVSAYLKMGSGSDLLLKRGDEKEGTDISYLLPYLNLPKIQDLIEVRGELVIERKTWESKYSSEYKNPRNMVSGITNAKTIEADKVRDLHFVAYQLYTKPPLPQSEQLSRLRNFGFHISPHGILKPEDLTEETLTAEIKLRKARSMYDIDGIVIAADIALDFPTDKEPDHVVAFKIIGETATTTIIRIEWEITKRGLFIPVAIIEPVQLSGATIERITAYHANFVRDSGLGPGAVVVVTRSGDTIPKILETVKPATPQMPNIPYEWIENNQGEQVDIRPIGQETDQQRIRKIVAFFKERGSEYLAEPTITKLYNAGFDTFKDLFRATPEQIAKIDGFAIKSAQRVVDNIQKAIKNAPLAEIMAGSCLFPNLGSKRLALMIEAVPNMLELKNDCEFSDAKTGILNIKGIGENLADIWSSNIKTFQSWLQEHSEITLDNSSENEDEKTSNDFKSSEHIRPLENQVIVFTGCRPDKLMERAIIKAGGRVASAISGTTTMLIVQAINKTTKKIQSAEARGIKIVAWSEFEDKYRGM